MKTMDINQGVAAFQATAGAKLLDVRPTEYLADGKIPDSLHVPSNELQRVLELVPDKETPIFVYCLDGTLAAQATQWLIDAGYANAVCIGGFLDYQGPVA